MGITDETWFVHMGPWNEKNGIMAKVLIKWQLNWFVRGNATTQGIAGNGINYLGQTGPFSLI